MLLATITRIQQAFKEIKHMQCDTWEGDYRPADRDALKDILEHGMDNQSTPIWSKSEPKDSSGPPKRLLPSSSPYGA